MNYLITGGTGFVGTHLCNYLAADEKNLVVCIDKFTKPSGKKNIRVCNADITDKIETEDAINHFDIDTIIHLAAQVRIDTAKAAPVETMQINLGGTQNLLEIARQWDIRKFVFASSAEVYGAAQYLPIDESHPLGTTSIYGASKIAGDRLCHAYAETYGMGVSILRPFNIYGPGQKGGVIPIFVEKALKDEPLVIHGDGSQIRDYIHVSDVVKAYEFLSNRKGSSTVNVGTGAGTSVKDLAREIVSLTRSSSKINYVGEPDGKTSCLIADTTAMQKMDWYPLVDIGSGLMDYIRRVS